MIEAKLLVLNIPEGGLSQYLIVDSELGWVNEIDF